MSYDLQIGDRDFNYTWNLGDFFREYIKSDTTEGLEALHNATGKESSVLLRSALERIKSDSYKRDNGQPAWKYFGEKYDPDNYWGDVMSATLFITGLYFAACDNPRKRWRYSS